MTPLFSSKTMFHLGTIICIITTPGNLPEMTAVFIGPSNLSFCELSEGSAEPFCPRTLPVYALLCRSSSSIF